MKKVLIISVFLLSIIACTNKSESFEYTIKGKVVGKDNGKLCFSESSRVGDEVTIPIENGIFEYCGTSTNIYASWITFCDKDYEQYYTIVIEPGEIVLELYADSLLRKSKTKKGENSIALQRAISTYVRYFDAGVDEKALPDSIASLVHKNRNNYASILMLNTMGRYWPLLDLDELGAFLEEVENPMFRQSRDFRELYSFWLSKRDSVNEVNYKAENFELADINGNLISFNEVSSGKITLVEKSGSWCGNSTQTTRSFMPVYEAYKDKGFEIITIVCESDYDRWVQWVEDEKIPWIALIELDTDINNEVLYSELLFSGGNYLVNMDGIVIAKDLSAEALKNLLEKEFEGDTY